MWDFFKLNGKKKKKAEQKKRPVKKKYSSRTAPSKSGKLKNAGIKPEENFAKPLQKTIDKKESKTKNTLSSIEQLRKEFEEKQRVIDALEKKLHHKNENNLKEKKQNSIPGLKNNKTEIVKKNDVAIKEPVNEIENVTLKPHHLEIEKRKQPIISKLENVFQIIDETIEEGFLGGVVVDKTSHEILYNHNIEANDTSFLANLLENIEQSLKKSSFPALNKFYMMDLVDDYLMLNLLFENQIYYLIFSKNETNLGLILNVLYDKIRQKHYEIINNLK